jgi:hypothetical protein
MPLPGVVGLALSITHIFMRRSARGADVDVLLTFQE